MGEEAKLEVVDVEQAVPQIPLEWEFIEDVAVIKLNGGELWVLAERLGKDRYALDLKLKVGEDFISEASVGARSIHKLMQPKYAPFRASLKRVLPKEVKLGDVINILQVKIASELIRKAEEEAKKRTEERRRKLERLIEEHRDELEPIIQDPVKHIMEVVNFYHVGDEVPKHQLLPVIVSRFLPRDKRLHTVILGPPSLGKNNLIKSFKRVTPKKWWFELTRLTPTALDYMPKSLGRQILYIQEYEGMRQAAYSARITLSEGNLTVAYTRRNEKTGEFETVNKKVVGTPVLITTTTQVSIDPDMENRTFYITPDASEKQTKEIINHIVWLETSVEAKLKEEEIKRKARILKLFFKTLRKVDVTIPKELADDLVKDLPLVVRARRDVKKLLYAVEAMAALNQHKREKKEVDGRLFVIAAQEDVNYVKRYFKPYLAEQMIGLTEHHKKILECMRNILKKNKAEYLTAKDKELWACSGLGYRQLKRYLDDLANKGQIIVDNTHRPYRYLLVESGEGLKKLDDIQKTSTNSSANSNNNIHRKEGEEVKNVNKNGIVTNDTNDMERSHTKIFDVPEEAKEALVGLDRCVLFEEVLDDLKTLEDPLSIIRLAIQDGLIVERDSGGEKYLCPPE